MRLPRRIAILVTAGVLSATSAAAEPLPRSVLIFNQTDPASPYYTVFTSAFRSFINANSGPTIALHVENFEAAKFTGQEYEAILQNYLREKYRNEPIGVIVAIGEVSLECILRWRATLWSGVPVVFTAVDQTIAAGFNLPPDVTGTTIRLTLRDAVVSARALVPNLKRIAFVGDSFDRPPFWHQFQQELPIFAKVLEYIDLMGLPMAELKQRVAALPDQTAIVYTGLSVDGAGVKYFARDALAEIVTAANRPIVIDSEVQLGYGGTGGFVVSVDLIGEEAARLALRILNGEPASTIPVTIGNFTRPVFDWRQLQRWGVSEARLPSGSEIRFRERTAWEQYYDQIMVIAAVVGLLIAMIAWLLYERQGRRQAETVTRATLSELAHINRVATAGELSGSIAHEIKQPLASMVTQASAGLRWLTRATPDLDEARAAFTAIISSGHNASNVIDSIRAMFKKGDPEGPRVPLDINELIRQVLVLVDNEQVKHQVSLNTALVRYLPEVTADRVQLQQVILNLVKNAIESMSSNTDRERVLRMTTGIHESGGVLVSIEDSGTGIDSKAITRVFDPLFTTKSHGMGVGLSICKTIIEAHGGRIWVLSDLHYGSIFQFMLPAARAESAS